ncbi:hypothetical protein GCM10023080_048070 [Streptomyces pseudoechinosporeus]
MAFHRDHTEAEPLQPGAQPEPDLSEADDHHVARPRTCPGAHHADRARGQQTVDHADGEHAGETTVISMAMLVNNHLARPQRDLDCFLAKLRRVLTGWRHFSLVSCSEQPYWVPVRKPRGTPASNPTVANSNNPSTDTGHSVALSTSTPPGDSNLRPTHRRFR